jgi:hypothetical protein
MSVSQARAGQRKQTRKELPADQLLVVDLIPANPGRISEKQLGIILNLSESGMAVQPFRPLYSGSVADFRFALPEMSVAPAGRGQVAWTREGGRAGLHFIDAPLADHERDRLREWLNRTPPDLKSDSALTFSALAGEAGASEFDTALRLIAYNALVSTGASGAAIALGNSQGMECRASAGNAPEVGALLRPDAGLSGLCLRTGRIVWSNDVRSDRRVDPSIADQLDLRSLVIVPITVVSRFAGLLEVFSNRPQAFNKRHLEQLQYLASVLSRAIQENRAGPNPEPDATAPAETEDTRAAQGVVVALQEANQEPGEELTHLESSAVTTSAGDELAEALTISAGEIVEVVESEKASLRRSLFVGAAIGAAILLALALWLIVRTNTRRPQIAGGQAAPLNAAPSPPPLLETAIRFDPAEIVQKVGATFSVNVMIHGAKNASFVPLQILYDPEKLQVMGVSGGALLERDGQKIALVHREDAAAGKIQIAASRPPTAPGITGDGALIKLVFLSKAPGRSRLRVNQTELRDPLNHLTSVDGIETVIDVSPSPSEARKEPTKATPAAKALRAAPATPDTSSEAVPAATVSNPAPEAASKTAPDAKPAPTSPGKGGALIVEGVRMGTLVQLDDRQGTANGPNGELTISDISPGEHHLQLSYEGIPYFDQIITVKPGETTKVAAHMMHSDLTPPAEPARSPGSSTPAPTAFSPKMVGPPTFVLARTLKGHSNWVTAVAFTADGQRLATGSWDKSVKLWDVASGDNLSTIGGKMSGKLNGVQALAFSHDGRWLAAEDASNNITVWNAETGAKVREIASDKPALDESWVYSIAFSPDSRWLVFGVDSKTVRLLDLKTGLAVRDLVGPPKAVIYVAFSPNGRWIATGGDSRSIVIWDAMTGKVSRTLKGHKKDVYAVAFSPNGKLLASASKDKTVRIWDMASGQEVFTLTGHQGWVTSLAFSPNSRWLATSSWDKTIKIWDVIEGHLVQTLSGHTHSIYSLAFDSRGGWLATGSEDGTTKLWRLRRDIDLAVLDDESSWRTRASATPAAHPN